MDDFFTRRHKTLDRIARIANLIAWGSLFFYGLLGISQIAFTIRELATPSYRDFLGNNPWQVTNTISYLLTPLLRAAGYWVFLRGISLGLNMILEIDLNGREQTDGVAYE